MSTEEKQAMNTDIEQEASTPVVAAVEPVVVVAEKQAEPAAEPKADSKAQEPAASSVTVSSETKTTKPKKQLCFPKVTPITHCLT